MLRRYPQLSFDWTSSTTQANQDQDQEQILTLYHNPAAAAAASSSSSSMFSRSVSAAIFQHLDTDKDGLVTRSEVTTFARMASLGNRSPDELFKVLIDGGKEGKRGKRSGRSQSKQGRNGDDDEKAGSDGEAAALSETDIFFALNSDPLLAVELDLQCKLLVSFLFYVSLDNWVFSFLLCIYCINFCFICRLSFSSNLLCKQRNPQLS
jgi:hypothetical protein